MKAQHEQLVILEEKCRKMKLQAKEKKKIIKDTHHHDKED